MKPPLAGLRQYALGVTSAAQTRRSSDIAAGSSRFPPFPHVCRTMTTLVRAGSLPSRLLQAAARKRPTQVILVTSGLSLRSLPFVACDGTDAEPPVSDPSPSPASSSLYKEGLNSAASSIVKSVVVAVALPYVISAAAPQVLAWIGFGSVGITADSIAASFQSCFGTPWIFRCLQSLAMRGVPMSSSVSGGLATVGALQLRNVCCVPADSKDLPVDSKDVPADSKDLPAA
ncbi:uncharacterized protein LOC117646744 isoform X2 [Thrips palmi]|uniref:Uncharacterized protein LOC117646744 isoform X2 n=1 Tax=Thrips palmi TaxID=161013 RepID=A0A6P8YUQ6_THRPL|nr:uncharacterized protein LOC117646744 isoform X2 [Thrips palmi]